jgi:hypothetical protein
MTTEQLADLILEYVRNNGNVTMAEVSRIAGEDGKGDIAWEIAPNVVIWGGMSDKLCDALEMVQKHTNLKPAHVLSYYADGAAMPYPIMKRSPPSGGYKKPHWLPVLLVMR